MSLKFFFFEDKEMLNQIRQHKWLTSQAEGIEIGFATAALDWTKRNQPQRFNRTANHAHASSENLSGRERRKYKRFFYDFPVRVQIRDLDMDVTSETADMNIEGIACKFNQRIPQNTEAKIDLTFQAENSPFRKSRLVFDSQVKKVYERHPDKSQSHYHTFIPFNDDVKEFLKKQTGEVGSYMV